MAFSGSLLLSSLVIISSIISLVLGATLAPDELTALKDVAETMGKKDWNFSVDPCTENAVSCDCDNTTCHVVSIGLVRQNLQGTLPKLVDLPHLQKLDFSRNLLSGTIPPEWGTLRLTEISLMGNRLTGSIPKEVGNITTLQLLQVEANQLSGALPPELGNLTSIDRMLLNSNNFTGELPASFAKLTTMTDFRVSDNNLTGKIPDFLQNWTNLTKLLIEASGLGGPIPSGIRFLTKLTDLRISYLNGTPLWPLPDISTMANLKTLILTSCNINGSLPAFLAKMVTIEDLDLSFNHFTGEIPTSYSSLSRATNMYFTGNALTGIIPNWVNTGGKIDLSYNNFTPGTSTLTCQEPNLNSFRSYSGDYKFETTPCPRGSRCSKLWYNLHINCGGNAFVDGDTTYEEDTVEAGSVMFHYSEKSHWAVSSTGHFLNNDATSDSYIELKPATDVQPNSSLYLTARLSPLSLTYYGYCMGNGNYTVVLHFAEIAFETGQLFSTLMRRVFHVYIQGNLVLKDFDIVVAAGGIGKGINITFPAVIVSNSTMEIRFSWAGRGKTGIPVRTVYGPLISAISVNPDFKPPSEDKSSITAGMIVGIVAAVIVVFSALGIVWWKYFLKPYRMAIDLRGLDLQTGSFTLRQLRAATNDFDLANKIGEGGFGSVYKGLLSDGTVIAVKQLSSKSKQGNREFVNEIGMISALQHPHLVKLYGCCIEGNQLLLVYEYLENNCLARALFGPEDYKLKLDWPTRHRICVGIARGLAYLHEESRLKIVHRDIKATNVLLDKDLNPKISDFGLAKLDDEDNTHISTRIAGTFGYMAPEYAMRGYLTDKADVYSFGIVALELVSGRSNTSFKTKEDSFYLLDWALILKEKGQLMDLVDPRLGSNFNKKEVMTMMKVALLCVNVSPAVRPSMSSVVSMLVGQAHIRDIDPDPSISSSEMNLKFKIESIQEQCLMDSQVRSDSAPWIGSSVSDLYPLNLYSVTSFEKTD